jgi:hypothetical protein
MCHVLQRELGAHTAQGEGQVVGEAGRGGGTKVV